MTDEEKEVIRLARSVIRDLGNGWPIRELQEAPEVVCAKLTKLLGEEDKDA